MKHAKFFIVLLSFCVAQTSVYGIQEITTASDYENRVIKGSQSKPVVVKWGAPWCGPCKSMEQPFQNVANELNKKYDFYKLNTEKASFFGSYNISGIPTFIVYNKGKEVNRLSGNIGEAGLRKAITSALP